MRGLPARIIALIVAGLIAVLFVIWAFGEYRQAKTAGKRAEVAEEQGGASLDAGVEAMNTAANVSAQAQEHDRLADEGAVEIRAAVEGRKGTAARAAACRLKAYRDTPDCKGQNP